MKRKKLVTAYLLSVLVSVISSSCAYDSREDFSAPCDKSKPSFSLNIQPILNNHCVECHSGGTPAGNLDLGSYQGVYPSIADGRLVGSIKHLEGFVPMPRLAPKLPDCDIMKIENWVKEGAPNN